MPAAQRNVAVKYETAGVGIGPNKPILTPAAAKPDSSADSSI